jgi:hypothetical protein
MMLDDKIKAFLSVSWGSGEGWGEGSGWGSGSGSGWGEGSGSGEGSGWGEGSGSGSGEGSGEGVTQVDGKNVYQIDGTPTLIQSIRGNVAHGAILYDDLTLTPCYVVKQDNLFAHGETLRDAMEALRDKLFEDMPEEERISAFLAETECGKKYPNQHFYAWHHRLTGSCDMGRKAFAKNHGIDVENGTMTLEKFLELTKNSYGGDVIRHVQERLAKK